VEDAAYTLSWDKDVCSWALTGQGVLKPVLSEAQQQIIDLLENEARSFTTAEISEAMGIKKYEVSRQAAALAAKGLIEKPVYGQWKSKNNSGTPQTATAPPESNTETLPTVTTVTNKPENPSLPVENSTVSTVSSSQINVPREPELAIW
jgi:hypothetical protein